MIPFVNLSDQRMKTWQLELLLELVESDRIFFTDATANEMRAVDRVSRRGARSERSSRSATEQAWQVSIDWDPDRP